jgi:nucleoside-diphosphate-sugar epimerase
MPNPPSGYESLKGRRVLITGGAGMIGSTVARLAADAGAKVLVVDNLAPLYGGNRFNLSGVDAQFVKGDIRDRKLMDELVRGQHVIFNLAAQVSYVDSNEDPFTDLEINCRGHLNVLEACRRINPKARLVFSSSRFVYGAIETRRPVKEDHPFNCLSVYGVHKLNGEKYYEFYHKAYGLQSVVFRIANPYGPRQQMKHGRYGILNWFVRQALEGKPLTVFGKGLQQRDYVYVDDLARGLLLGAAATRIEHDTFNIGSGKGLPFKRMAELVSEKVGNVPVKHVAWPEKRYFVETGDYISDISKIKRALGWTPRVPIEEGVERTVAFYRENGARYFSLPRRAAAR